MVVNVEPDTVLYKTLQSPSKLEPVQVQPIIPFRGSTKSNYFKVRYVFTGETTQLLFTEKPSTHQRIVMKILKEYEDLRYHMATVSERQQCQLEALKHNRQYSPDIYFGLARLIYLDLDNKGVYLGEIIKEPENVRFDENAEYVLLMRWLPKSRELDCLLKTDDMAIKLHYMELLGEAIAKMHSHSADVGSKEIALTEPVWGSCRQLKQKLDHNLSFLRRTWQVVENEPGGSINVNEAFLQLEKLMLRALQLPGFRVYFKERLHQKRIQHCHGDLKAANIWILQSEKYHTSKGLECVQVLDAIDFNDTYCNIDVLADIAMLAVDIEVKTSSDVAQHFIHHYLKLTEQEDEAAKAVLTYYLVEKAMIGIIVSFLYDKKPEVAMQYLGVAEKHMSELQSLERIVWLKSIAKEKRWERLPHYISVITKQLIKKMRWESIQQQVRHIFRWPKEKNTHSMEPETRVIIT